MDLDERKDRHAVRTYHALMMDVLEARRVAEGTLDSDTRDDHDDPDSRAVVCAGHAPLAFDPSPARDESAPSLPPRTSGKPALALQDMQRHQSNPHDVASCSAAQLVCLPDGQLGETQCARSVFCLVSSHQSVAHQHADTTCSLNACFTPLVTDIHVCPAVVCRLCPIAIPRG